MKPILLFWLVMAALELGAYWRPLWRRRKQLASLLTIVEVSGLVWLLIYSLNLATILISVIGLYRLINLVRLFKDRIQAKYLRSIGLRSSLSLISLQALVAVLGLISSKLGLSASFWLYLTAGSQLALAAVLLASIIKNEVSTEPVSAGKATKNYPALSVCLPARNETDDLNDCLTSLVQSNYPKLEIIVLDDCSQTKRTPAIIRRFASYGVRFIGGQLPPDSWLAKNYTYSQLAEVGSGDIILFCGVDTLFESDSLNEIVDQMIKRKLNMMSLMPINRLPSDRLDRLLIQPARYLWELALPRLWLNRPPVLSTCWLVKRDFLVSSGGLKTVAHKIRPEGYFARLAAKTNSYRFLRSGQHFKLTSHKSFDSQYQTAIRTRYPQTRRRPEIVCLLSLVEFMGLMWPLLLVILGFIYTIWPIVVIAALAGSIQLYIYAEGVRLCYDRFLPLSLVTLPLAVFYDVVILNYSMYLYEFREVTWKGRNICLPVMHLQPQPALN